MYARAFLSPGRKGLRNAGRFSSVLPPGFFFMAFQRLICSPSQPSSDRRQALHPLRIEEARAAPLMPPRLVHCPRQRGCKNLSGEGSGPVGKAVRLPLVGPGRRLL
jgi:hypothetical protein